MPVPGPRNQYRPEPGYTNPGGEDPSRINRWHRPGPVVQDGRTPGTMYVNAHGNMLGAGTIRRLWRQSVDYIAAQAPYSWTRSAPGAGGAIVSPGGFFITTALRYMTRSVYAPAGADNTRYGNMHTVVRPKVRSKPVSVPAGGVKNRPTVRNRLTSFGSRVPPLNSKSGAAL